MDKEQHIAPPPRLEPAQAWAPIRRLVAAALICAFLAVIVLVSSAVHVMETTDAAELARERERASAIADMILAGPGAFDEVTIAAYGRAAGLRGLRIDDAARSGEDSQSQPLLTGVLGGKFLNWTTSRPGKALFYRFAPARLPVAVALIACVLSCLVLMMRHVRGIERQRRLAERQAMEDHLTGLPNRLAMEEHLGRLTASGQGFSVLAMDLDQFKPINDRFGHHVGDGALRIVAQRLKGQMLAGELLARIGGDEFVAIVHRNSSRLALAELAQDCILAVSAPMTELGDGIALGISIGIVIDGLAEPSGAPLKLADRALYGAKRQHGGAYRIAGEQYSSLPEPLSRRLLSI